MELNAKVVSVTEASKLFSLKYLGDYKRSHGPMCPV